MKYKKFTFTFVQPISCYNEIITEDVVFAPDLKKALKILKKEHYYAKVKDTKVQEVELFREMGREVNIYQTPKTTTLNKNLI